MKPVLDARPEDRRPVSEEHIEQALKEAERLRRKKQYKEGIDLLVDVLEAGILKPRIYYHLGNIYYDMGRLDLAEYAYKRAIEFEPEYVNAHYNLSVLYKRKGNIDASAKMLRKAYSLELKHPRKHKELTPEQRKWARVIAAKQGMLLIGIGIGIFIAIFLILRIVFENYPALKG